MNKSPSQFIVISCALLFQLGVFASLAHAAEHPFHVENDLCASFINFGQHDLSIDAPPVNSGLQVFAVETVVESKQFVRVSFRHVYFSRAPPVS